MYGASDVLFGGGDHVTMIGHAETGMGYRNDFQTENYGLLRLLTNQALFRYGCALPHMSHA